MTEPKKKQDGTMELDVGQIDLLDLALPPSSKGSLEEESEKTPPRAHKGPPPLPPEVAAPPPAPELEVAKPADPVPVPSLPPRAVAATKAISARKLVDGPASGMNPVLRFLLGVGAASIVCVGALFAIRAVRKAPAAAASAPEAPTHAFTMAPIEFTEPAASESSAPSPPPAASASGASSAMPHATAASPSPSKPRGSPAGPSARPDELIKVEN